MTQQTLMRIEEAPELYADALLVDAYNKLLFISLWGRDTSIQEFLARVTLSQDEDGLHRFTLVHEYADGHHRKQVLVGDIKRLDHTTGRLPSQNLFGNMVQLWLFDQLASVPDLATRRAIALFRHKATVQHAGGLIQPDQIWQMVKSLCHLPLLDHWSNHIIDTFLRREWIMPIDGLSVHGALIDLSMGEEIETEISHMIHQGVLTAQ